MRKLTALTVLALLHVTTSYSQQKTRWIDGMYLQWGYNGEWYTRSNIRFRMANGDDFTVYKAKAHHSPGYHAILKEPWKISLPQYNYRMGFYLNKAHTKAVEINFDHAKYVVTDGQQVRVSGTIDGKTVYGDSILNPATFFHFEHTDGANWLHFNYVEQHTIATTTGKYRKLLSTVWKAGAGFNIPRSDFTWRGERLNNKFHISGYNISAEGGLRLYPLRNFFLEFTGKSGYVRYINALAETSTSKGNRARHGFGYLELIGTFGFDIKW